MTDLTLVSHHLCPYVQRAAIALSEKGVNFERIYVDLGNKPDWFKELSPLGKVPLLKVADGDKDATIFESAVILEYLEETQPNPLHPQDALERARHRAWGEFGSQILNRIWNFYTAPTDADLAEQAGKLAEMFARIEHELGDGPYFSGAEFSIVDAVYGPIFRYFDVFDHIEDFHVFDGLVKVKAWRETLAARDSIKTAVTPDYNERLRTFLINRNSAISAKIKVAA